MNYSFVFFFLINLFFMLFLLRCFYGILFYFTCVGYFNLTYLGTLIPSFIWEENRNNSFVADAFIFFFPCLQLYIIKQGLQMILYSLFIFFPYFFVGSKLNLIIAFEVFFLLCPFLFIYFFFAPKECTTIYVVCQLEKFNIMSCLVK